MYNGEETSTFYKIAAGIPNQPTSSTNLFEIFAIFAFAIISVIGIQALNKKLSKQK